MEDRGDGRRSNGALVLISRLAPIAVILATALWLYRGLLTSVPFQSHEGLNPYVRTHEYLREFAHGNWIPQVFPDAVRAAGSAFPRFYPPLAHLFSAALAWVTGDVILGVNLSFLLATLLSAVAMYYLVIKLTADRVASLAAALLYLSAPYRFMDVFIRGALAEAWSFVWYPLILAGTWCVLVRRRLPWYLPVVWAALLLTHTITAVYFVLFYAVLLIAVLIRQRDWRPPGVLVGAAAIGLGLSLWFLLPQQLGLHTVPVSEARVMGADLRSVVIHEVSVRQLVGDYRNAWSGPSWPTTAADYQTCPRAFCPVDFTLGTGQLLAIALTMAVLVAAALRQGAARARAHAPPRAPRTVAPGRATWLLGILLLGWWSSIAFMIKPGPFLRILPSAFGFIQFPWRLLGLSGFFAAAMLGIATAAAPFRRSARLVVVVAAIMLVLAVPAYLRSPQFSQRNTERAIGPILHGAATDRGFTVASEYLPKALDPRHLNTRLSELPEIRGHGTVVSWHRRNGDLVANVDVTAASVIVFPILYYDFYRVTADGSRDLPTFETAGFLAARLPAHTARVRVSERLNIASRAGLAASALSAILLIGVLLGRRVRARRESAGREMVVDRLARDPKNPGA